MVSHFESVHPEYRGWRLEGKSDAVAVIHTLKSASLNAAIVSYSDTFARHRGCHSNHSLVRREWTQRPNNGIDFFASLSRLHRESRLLPSFAWAFPSLDVGDTIGIH